VSESLIHSLWVAAALVLVIEGLMPFLSPTVFRRALQQMTTMSDSAIRSIGLLSMLSGLLLLYWIN
jgi:uncharacterized protein YjeT (DUF2065 family)